nr:MAG TPA: hypothetical protein [Caudoviricetes sp.]
MLLQWPISFLFARIIYLAIASLSVSFVYSIVLKINFVKYFLFSKLTICVDIVLQW